MGLDNLVNQVSQAMVVVLDNTEDLVNLAHLDHRVLADQLALQAEVDRRNNLALNHPELPDMGSRDNLEDQEHLENLDLGDHLFLRALVVDRCSQVMEHLDYQVPQVDQQKYQVKNIYHHKDLNQHLLNRVYQVFLDSRLILDNLHMELHLNQNQVDRNHNQVLDSQDK